jgi:beta-carotene/zeaxanthin 4-ketolase
MTEIAQTKNVNEATANVDKSISLVLSVMLIGSWLSIHVAAIFFVNWGNPNTWALAPVLIILQTWMSVGLFIIAHDTMHGSLAPGIPWLNRLIGQFCVMIYAGFSYQKLYESHHAHHRHVGTAEDPDFDMNHPKEFWPWYCNFFSHYFGWRELGILSIVVAIYAWILGDRFPVLLAFWAVPALLSSVQLFYFGTFRPHRLESVPFADNHRSRSENFSWIVSLLTCFHFGYHHEHHEKPWVPWWKLPKVHKSFSNK